MKTCGLLQYFLGDSLSRTTWVVRGTLPKSSYPSDVQENGEDNEVKTLLVEFHLNIHELTLPRVCTHPHSHPFSLIEHAAQKRTRSLNEGRQKNIVTFPTRR